MFEAAACRKAQVLIMTLAFLLSGQCQVLRAAELKPDTRKAWETYARETESRINSELTAGGGFLVLDFQAKSSADADRRALQTGRVLVARMSSRDREGRKIPVPDGMIHHWRGCVFIPGADLQTVLARVANPTAHEIKQDDVLRSAVLERGTGYLKLYLKLQRSKIVTVVYNTEHEVRYHRPLHGRAWSSSRAVKIAELDHPNSPEEAEKPEGQDHGFLWRLNSYWRYEQVDGGVFVECESISLSRSLPASLEVFIRPIIDMVARESMERTLVSMRERFLQSRPDQRGSGPAGRLSSPL